MKQFPLRCFLTLFVILSGSAQSKTTNIRWTKPSEGDSFVSGSIIVAQWQATVAVVSPSFTLCSASEGLEPDSSPSDSDSDDQCGSAVWPAVTHSAGFYSASITAPNVSTVDAFYITMKDDFGKNSISPTFSIEPAVASPVDTKNVSPLNSSTPSSSLPFPAPGNPTPTTNSITPSLSKIPPTSSGLPYLTVSRSPPPVAAFAVPLSLVGAILLTALGLCIRHHKSLKEERARDAARGLTETQKSSFLDCKSDSTNWSDVERSGGVLWKNEAVPFFSPADIRREARRSIRQPFYSLPPPSYRSGNQPGQTRTIPMPTRPPSRSLTPAPPRANSAHFADEQAANAAATDSVISTYFHPSPAPPPAPLLPAPQRLHTRREFETIPSSLHYAYGNARHKSQFGVDNRDPYDAIARAVGR